MLEDLKMNKYILDEKFSDYFNLTLKDFNPMIRLKIYYYTLQRLEDDFPFVTAYKKLFVYSSRDDTDSQVFIGRTEDDERIIPIGLSKELNFDGGKISRLTMSFYANRVWKKENYTILDVDELKEKLTPLDELDCSMLRDYVVGKGMDSNAIDGDMYPILFSYHCTKYIDIMAPFYRVWLEAYRYLATITPPFQTEEGKEYIMLNDCVCRDMGKITGYPGLFLIICSEKAYKKHPEIIDIYPKTKEEAMDMCKYVNGLNATLSHELRSPLFMKYKYVSENFYYFAKK